MQYTFLDIFNNLKTTLFSRGVIPSVLKISVVRRCALTVFETLGSHYLMPLLSKGNVD